MTPSISELIRRIERHEIQRDRNVCEAARENWKIYELLEDDDLLFLYGLGMRYGASSAVDGAGFTPDEKRRFDSILESLLLRLRGGGS